MQYTIRKVSDNLDAALSVSALEQGKSLNEVMIKTRARGFDVRQFQARQRGLNDIAGSWRLYPALEFALAAQATVEDETWL